MKKNLKLFIVSFAICLPVNLLISYVSDGGKLTLQAFAGDLVVTILIIAIVGSVSKFSAPSNKK